jgi:hypothetical protein
VPGNKKLFLSAVSREFRACRELLTGDLKRPLLDVAVQEDFIVTGGSTLEKLDDYIRACDGIIHLVGKATGHAAEESAVAALLRKYPDFATRLPPLAPALSKPQPGFSYTQWEAYLALYHRRPLFVYRPTDFDSDADVGFDPAEVLAQREHYQRISALGHDRGQFLNEERLSSAVLRDLVEILPRLQPSIAVSPTRLRHTAARLIGRDEDLARLDAAWNGKKNVVVVRAFGGMGKTSLVATWMAELAMKNWRGAERVFDWSFYSQGTSDQGNASADVFIAAALKDFGDPDPTLGSPWDRGARLAALVGKARCLLVLDGLEPLQYPPGPMQGKLKDAADALRKEPVIGGLTEPLVALNNRKSTAVARRLEEIHLLTVQADGSLDAHPLLREYFGQSLRTTQPEAWRAAHQRLYEYLCATTKDKPDATLEDLQPLYQAVAHGCQAGLQQEACEEVYRDRIQRGEEAYSVHQLGAFGSDLGAVACFFEIPWSRVSPALTEGAQAWLLNEAATRLRSLGRLTEALEPMRAGLENYVEQENWESAAISASNLSELELTLGEVTGPVKDAERSVTYADRSGNAFLRMVNRITFADALHQAGRQGEAEVRFREAEQMQAERQPYYALLYSLQGFRYCDLLLMEAEREAGNVEGELKKEEGLASCRAVTERAGLALQIVLNGSRNLLDIALNHLTLGRAALYAAILESRRRRESAQTSFPSPALEKAQYGFTSAATELDQAVSGLRRAGTQDQLPRGLLSRAWRRGLTGPRTGPESAQSDLDEAWDIAERGPMPLFLADIRLYRARLFFREGQYPWQSPQHDLAEARRLIFKHGYLRRKEELEDAEVALKHFAEVSTQ